jgi:hypothetical protein
LIDKNWLLDESSIRKMGSDVKKKKTPNFWDALLGVLVKLQENRPPQFFGLNHRLRTLLFHSTGSRS